MSEAFHHQPHRRAKGRVGEREAVAWLKRHGMRILDRNVTTKAGEIDIVARDGDTLVYVEVKARADSSHGSALDAVTPAKQRRVARAGALDLARRRWTGPCRFDVLALDWHDGEWCFTHVPDAFFAS
ncbi:MAG: YraN family protein [Acidobacteriota bacterium]